MSIFKEIKTPLVGVGVVVEDCSSNNILVIQRKYPPLGYSFPAGMMDIGETATECGIRETKEETNLDIEVHGLLTILSSTEYDPRCHIVSIWLVGKDIGHSIVKAQDDALDAFWMPWDKNRILNKMTKGSKFVFECYKNFRFGINVLSPIS